MSHRAVSVRSQSHHAYLRQYVMTENIRKGIISFSITDRGALYSAYMSFVSNGGLFIPTTRNYELGDNVFMLLQFMHDPSVIFVGGDVVWVTPSGAQGNKVQGIGVQFSDEDDGGTRTTIERYLEANLTGERATQTM